MDAQPFKRAIRQYLTNAKNVVTSRIIIPADLKLPSAASILKHRKPILLSALLIFFTGALFLFIQSLMLRSCVVFPTEDSHELLLHIAEKNYKRYISERREKKNKIDCTDVTKKDKWHCGLDFFKMTYLTPTYSCYNELHVADWADGGNWLCDIRGAIRRKGGIVYRAGSDGRIGFESSIFDEFRIKSYTFEAALPVGKIKWVKHLKFLRFNEIGLTGASDLNATLQSIPLPSPKARVMRIDELMTLLNHSYADVIKIDCEACEETFIPHLKTVSKRNEPRFGQIVIEMHRLRQMNASLPVFEAIEDMGYRLFHAEPNFHFSEGNWQLSYIHESLVLPKTKN